MDLGANGMSGTMNEVIAEAGLRDVISRCPIYFPAAHSAAAGDAFLHCLYSSITGIANHVENFAHAVRRSVADEAGPGNVVINGCRRIFLRPDVEQNKIALANGCRVFSTRFIMRVAAMGVNSDDR